LPMREVIENLPGNGYVQQDIAAAPARYLCRPYEPCPDSFTRAFPLVERRIFRGRFLVATWLIVPRPEPYIFAATTPVIADAQTERHNTESAHSLRSTQKRVVDQAVREFVDNHRDEINQGVLDARKSLASSNALRVASSHVENPRAPRNSRESDSVGLLSVIILIRVKPGASRARVGGSHGDPPALVVSVHAQPVDGGANAAVVQALADALGLKTRQLRIVSGHASRTKRIEIIADVVDEAALTARVTALMAQ